MREKSFFFATMCTFSFSKMRLLQAAFLLLLLTSFSSCKKESNTTDDLILSDNDNMLMGNSSNAGTNENNYLMRKDQFSLSYSRSRCIANWVSWHTESSDIGTANRQDDYREDPEIPSSWYKATENLYSGTGFDKGHLCPSGDRTNSVTNNSATFLMTNIIPQAPDNNQLPWADLEVYARDLVLSGNELYTIAGVLGTGGIGLSGYSNGIDQGRIAVPASTWKVIVVLSNGNDDLNRVDATTRVIAISIPNSNIGIKPEWRNYRVSVDAIESQTGYNILSSLPESIQSLIESKVDNK